MSRYLYTDEHTTPARYTLPYTRYLHDARTIESVRIRFSRLGITHIYMKSAVKNTDFADFMQKTGLQPEEVMYAGDDIPDYDVMKLVGLPIAPSDAAPEIKRIAKYISHKRGGEGVARDIIEQTLKAQGHWMFDGEIGRGAGRERGVAIV